MKSTFFIIFASFALLIPASAQSWLEGTWNVRGVEIRPEDDTKTEFFEEYDVITFSNFTGEQVTFAADGDDPMIFSVEESGDLYQLTHQGFEHPSTEFELMRAFRINEQLAFFMIISVGGNGTSLDPIYWTEAVAGIMSKGTLPPAPPTTGLAGEYRGFSFDVRADAGRGYETGVDIFDVSIAATQGGYTVADAEDAEDPTFLTVKSGYLEESDFSQHNSGSTGDFESLLVFPVTDTMVAFLRLEANANPQDQQYMNYLNVDGEAGLLSRDPDYQIPDFIKAAQGNGLPPVFAGAQSIAGSPGWFYLNWFKGFRPADGSNWIYHGRHGWLFYAGGESNSVFLWDAAMKRWFFTTPSAYPWMYGYGANGGWVYFFEGGRPGSRFFKRGDTGAVVSEAQLGL